jgi:hypothetical protein
VNNQLTDGGRTEKGNTSAGTSQRGIGKNVNEIAPIAKTIGVPSPTHPTISVSRSQY